jgi:hypothetical protein
MKIEPKASDREVLAGLVERVTYQNAENGFCVVRVRVRGRRELVTVVGHARASVRHIDELLAPRPSSRLVMRRLMGGASEDATGSNIRAVWHLDEFVVPNVRAIPRVHLFPADFTVCQTVILGHGFVVPNFIYCPAVRAFKSFRHPKNILWLGVGF